ncbi:MAG: hypothetical protein JST09_08055 [Bacteroidetes bacterium]|nr:hypothetical protein [Bacteroidota bacterium]
MKPRRDEWSGLTWLIRQFNGYRIIKDTMFQSIFLFVVDALSSVKLFWIGFFINENYIR